MHPARLYGGFWTIFFCLVCGPLEKKKISLTRLLTSINLISARIVNVNFTGLMHMHVEEEVGVGI